MTPKNISLPSSIKAFKSGSYSVTSSGPETTVVLIPWKGDKKILQCVDALYARGGPRFRLIVVDQDSPESVRSGLDERARRYGNLCALFTNRRLRLGEAWNLALIHIRTPHVIFTTSHVQLDRAAFGPFVEALPEKKEGFARPNGHAAIHTFLTTQKTLARLSFFDESIDSEAAFERFLVQLAADGFPMLWLPGSLLLSKPSKPGRALKNAAITSSARYLEAVDGGLSSSSNFVKLISKTISQAESA